MGGWPRPRFQGPDYTGALPREVPVEILPASSSLELLRRQGGGELAGAN